MNTIKMKIADLQHPEKNIRRHPEKQIKEMKRSLKMFGQFRPVVVDENNVILCGNGLVTAMREDGYTEAEVLKYNDLTDKQKKKLMIADNQITSLGLDDYSAIEEFIKELGDDIDVPGYDEETLRMIIEESESATEAALSYGVYTEAETSQIRAVEEERETKGIQPVAQTYSPEPQESYIPSGNNTGAIEEEKTYAKPHEADRYVICPHCGEKIYI